MTLIGWPLARSTARGCARREVLTGGTQNAVSRIFSGLDTRSSRKSARHVPAAASARAAGETAGLVVSPPRPGRRRGRRLGGPLALLRWRELARVVVANACEVEPCLGISVPDRSVDGDLAVGQSRRMAEQI